MSAPALRELQQLFFRSLVGDVAPGLRDVVCSTPALDAGARLGVYADMYFVRLRGVLAEDFEKTAAVLGDETFTAVARSYLDAHPSEHPSVRHVGRLFASHLRDHLPAEGPPWVADLAALEWARVEAFDAADATSVGSADLATVLPEDWADLRFMTIPALSLVETSWPVHLAWADPSADLTAEPTVIRVWRQDQLVSHCAIDPAEHEALRRLLAGEPFGVICEAFSDFGDEEAAAAAGAVLLRWIEDGLIAGRRSS
jgi:hypothetical protein